MASKKGKKITDIISEAEHLRNVEGNLEGAIEILDRALPSAEEADKVVVLNKLASLYLDIGQTRKSIQTYERAITMAREVGNELSEADALRKLGYILWKTEVNAGKSIALAEQALSITNEHPNVKEYQAVEASAWATIGNVLAGSGRLDEGLKAYQQGLNAARGAGYKEREVTILGDIGNVCLWRGEFGEAEKYFQNALEGAERFYRHAFPSTLLRLGMLFANPENPTQDLKKAEGFCRQSFNVAKEEGWRREQADALDALGRLHIAQRKKAEALNVLKKALQIYQEVEHLKQAESVQAQIDELQ
ncbi:MAG: tetratricopeptide repeat protein [Candidatus Cloacimonetes bacterium]|nr:tetratricopeptide repeat protein [Candidatus Cloacimonadota bacterium]